MRLQGHVIRAVFWRNFISYFSNPIGYLFITAFVLGCAYFAFWHNDSFFANNLADLDQLNAFFPYLLLFFVPAITMTVWAEERRSGTEELLLTLPASDLEIVLGKYFACLAIYCVSLIFSISNVVVLCVLGNPDLGLMASTYLGIFSLGAALVSAGMVASLLTSNVTVSFILGSAICLLLVAVHQLAQIFPPDTAARDACTQLGVVPQFEPFGKGLISLRSVFYFISLVVVMLYLNIVLLSRRHWGGSQQANSKWGHSLTRAVALIVSAVSITLIAQRAEAFIRVDATQERIFSLTPRAKDIIRQIDPKSPVLIEAFISPTVPREYVETRKNLIDILSQFDAIGGDNIQVKIHDADLFTQAARDAERVYDIKPVETLEDRDGRRGRAEVFLGVAIKSGLNTKTIPFMYKGLPIEYELTRVIRTVSQRTKRKVGILSTDASLFGSFNMQLMQPSRDWVFVDELRQQYDVMQISPDTPIVESIDCLIVPMASSLSDTQLDNLVGYVRSGKPTLILDDPLPFFVNPKLAAREPKQRQQQNPMFGGGAPPPIPKGNLNKLTDLLNIEFDTGNVIWQRFNPHPRFKDLPPEYVFIGPGSGNKRAFNPDSIVSAGLQDSILLYPGSIRSKAADGPKLVPLLETSGQSGIVGTRAWNDVIKDGMFGMAMLNPSPRRRTGSGIVTLAGLVEGKLTESAIAASKPKPTPPDKDEKPKEEKPEKDLSIKVIFVGDLDFISDAFFELRKEGEKEVQFDNVTFIGNCVDYLVGDESFIELRKKRLKRRNLELIGQLTKAATDKAQQEEERSETEATDALQKAQSALDQKVEEIRSRKDLPRRDAEAMIQMTREVEQRKFDKQKSEIESTKRENQRRTQDELQMQIRGVQSWIKLLAVLLPPIPALLVGFAVWLGRLAGEREGVSPTRLVG